MSRAWGTAVAALMVLAACGDDGAGTLGAGPEAPGAGTLHAGTELAALNGELVAVWAVDGGDKVAREERRAFGDPESVLSARWDGERALHHAARNEVVGLGLVLEAGEERDVWGVGVALDRLEGPGGAAIVSAPAADSEELWRWVDRPIEVFVVRYLQVKGLSLLGYTPYYDERHVPERLRRPWSGDGVGAGGWVDRPDHDRHYPDIVVPHELEPSVVIPAGQSQLFWVDVYVPKGTPPGDYDGLLRVSVGGIEERVVPFTLTVHDVELPERPSATAILFVGVGEVNERYLAEPWPYAADEVAAARQIMDRHFALAHRHKIALDTEGVGEVEGVPEPWHGRLDGSLFTAANGYAGPGEGTGTAVYMIGTYGHWMDLWDATEADLQALSDLYVTWFEANAPETDYFLYLLDEPLDADFPLVEQWAKWIAEGPGPGAALPTMATVGWEDAAAYMPSLSMPCGPATFAGPTPDIVAQWEALEAAEDRSTCLYNGFRPGTGTMMTEDDGVSPRMLPWTMHKKGIDRWFSWHGTYYDDFQAGEGPTNVFREARTFGSIDEWDDLVGETGWNYSNGDGVLFYPGTDTVFPEESYDVAGPLVSLRLKALRRGIQDVDYLALAAEVDPVATQAVIDATVPEVMWEVGVATLADPSWVLTDISWSTDPDDWDAARAALVAIIEGAP